MTQLETRYHCPRCGMATTGRAHYYCAGFNHFVSIGERIEAMGTAFGIGDRPEARQQLGYLLAEAQLWHDELGEDEK